jgi:hypothetical protein
LYCKRRKPVDYLGWVSLLHISDHSPFVHRTLTHLAPSQLPRFPSEHKVWKQAVANRVGVVEPFLLRMAHGVPIMEQRSGGRPRNGRGSSRGRISPAIQKSKWCSPSGPQLTIDQMLRVCKRFYVALMLSKLVQVTKARTPSTHRGFSFQLYALFHFIMISILIVAMTCGEGRN